MARSTASSGMVYERSGSGSPVVLLHGWCLNGRLWMYEAERLAGQYDVVVPDLPGFGLSDGLAGPYDLGRYSAAVRELLAELGLEPAMLVGFAFGAAVAMRAASDDPEGIAGIVAIGVPSAAHAPYERMPRAMRRDWPDFARRSGAAICRQPQSEATLNWLSTMFGATPLAVAIDTVALLASFEPEELAPKVRVPSLYVHGAEDDVVPVSISEACVAAAPDAALRIVRDSGHLVVIDQKEQLHEVITEQLGLLAARA